MIWGFVIFSASRTDPSLNGMGHTAGARVLRKLTPQTSQYGCGPLIYAGVLDLHQYIVDWRATGGGSYRQNNAPRPRGVRNLGAP